MLTEKIYKAVRKAVLAFDTDSSAMIEFSVSAPKDLKHGDFATNAAIILANKKSRPAVEVANDLANKLKLDQNISDEIEKIEVLEPGFINFYLNQNSVVLAVSQIAQGENKTSGSTRPLNVVLEFGQPNTHKLPHIGHLYSYILGESLARILIASGHNVHRVNYQGDVGLHVAKCLWAFKKQKPTVPEALEEKIILLQKMYEEGSRAYEQDSQAKEEIIKTNQSIYNKDRNIINLWKQTRQWSVDYYKQFEKRLNITYEKYYFESEVYEKAIDIVKQDTQGIFKSSQGAIIFEGSKYGLHDRVFLTKWTTPTYEAKDLALQELKMQEYKPDLIIITTASEQNEYFKVIFKALEQSDQYYQGKLKHIGFGMINLKSGKMSSRTGNILSAVDLVDQTIGQVKQLVDQSSELAEMVGLGAVKYSFLKNNPLQNMTFDLEESISKEGNSGPYLQYTFARTQSVLAKAKFSITNFQSQSDKLVLFSNIKLEQPELVLGRKISRFNDTIITAAKLYSPNVLAEYLYDLSREFNSFYNNNKILGSGSEDVRLLMTHATGVVLKNGLNLLGIDAPDRM